MRALLGPPQCTHAVNVNYTPPPVGIRVILATMQQDVGTSVILENNFKTCNKRWDATFRVRNQRKGWQPARAALAGNATLMEHSLGYQTALTNGLDQRP